MRMRVKEEDLPVVGSNRELYAVTRGIHDFASILKGEICESNPIPGEDDVTAADSGKIRTTP